MIICISPNTAPDLWYVVLTSPMIFGSFWGLPVGDASNLRYGCCKQVHSPNFAYKHCSDMAHALTPLKLNHFHPHSSWDLRIHRLLEAEEQLLPRLQKQCDLEVVGTGLDDRWECSEALKRTLQVSRTRDKTRLGIFAWVRAQTCLLCDYCLPKTWQTSLLLFSLDRWFGDFLSLFLSEIETCRPTPTKRAEAVYSQNLLLNSKRCQLIQQFRSKFTSAGSSFSDRLNITDRTTSTTSTLQTCLNFYSEHSHFNGKFVAELNMLTTHFLSDHHQIDRNVYKQLRSWPLQKVLQKLANISDHPFHDRAQTTIEPTVLCNMFNI